MKKITNLIFVLISFVFPLALYLKTLAPTYVPVDSAEFTLCMHFLGICHPPGFFLYILIGKIFTSLFPFGSLIYKANLLSAIFGSATILFVYLTLLKLEVDKKIALFTSFLLATSSVFWEYSLAADVFTFATFLLALNLWFVFSKKILWSFLVLGLSVSHFYLTLVLLPVFAWYFGGFKLRLPLVIKAIFIFGLGLFAQPLLYVRMLQNPEINWGHVQSFDQFLDFVFRREFGSLFLIHNSSQMFSLGKLFGHFFYYLIHLNLAFLLLPLIIIVSYFTHRTILTLRSVRLLLLSWVIITIFQLFILSSVDPKDPIFEGIFNKFYLLSFIPFSMISGLVLTVLLRPILQKKPILSFLPFVLLVFVVILNFGKNDYSSNYLSHNLVLNALSQLPQDSIVITIDHAFYFGGLYEQKINGKFGTLKLIYIPNENNVDAEKYYPDVFANPPNEPFIQTITKKWTMGKVEQYTLNLFARTLDKPVYILQTPTNSAFFKYLEPYLKPYGLWWQLTLDPESNIRAVKNELLLEKFKSDETNSLEIHQSQQQREFLTYSLAFHHLGVLYAQEGNFDKAIENFTISHKKNPQDVDISKKIALIAKTKDLEVQKTDLIANKDKFGLLELGMNYYQIGDYRRALSIFLEILKFEKNEGIIYSNIGSSYANLGEKEKAKVYFHKALELNPNLDFAKEGLEKINESNDIGVD